MLGMLDSSWVHLYMTLGLVGGAPTGRGSLVVVGEPAVWGHSETSQMLELLGELGHLRH